jgi:hypothetical protein
MSTISTRSLLSDITLEHGPTDLIGRFLLIAEEAVKKRGLQLSFAPFSELVAVNEANRDSWLPLVPTFDPRYSNLTPETAFCIVGRDAKGDVITTQCGRYWDLGPTNLADHLASLRFYYEDPDSQRGSGERCEVTTPAAGQIRGRVCFTGAVWYRPDFRGREMPRFMARIARAYAYTRWATDYSTGMCSEAVMKTRMPQMIGHTNIDWAVEHINSPMLGTSRFALLWMDTTEMLSELARFLADSSTQVDIGIDQRRAQEQS